MDKTSPLFLIAFCLAPLGCRLWTDRPRIDYRTVETAPYQDTEEAEEKTRDALEHIEEGRWDKAEQALQEALVADVSYGPAHNNLGRIYFRDRKYYLAAWEFEYARKLMPDRPEPINNLGLVFEAVGKLDMAVMQFEAAHDMSPDNPEYLGNLIRARLRRGDSPRDVQPLLRELVFYEDRPQWSEWARELLAHLPADSSEKAEFPTERLEHDFESPESTENVWHAPVDKTRIGPSLEPPDPESPPSP